jgi:outer membrane protein OmpA-like peptidoglycan-associated protein
VNASSPVVNSESETRSVKAEVLKRIEIMPDLTPDKRNKLYQSVDRAHSMTKIAVIPFEAGQTSMSGQVVTDLLTRLRAHELKPILDDPAAVFVILGYADKQGDEQKNLQISKARADSAVKVLQNQGKVLNVLRPVGMGSSTLFGAHHLAKNRLVEVWVVQM